MKNGSWNDITEGSGAGSQGFRVLFGFDQRIGDLDKKRFQITAGAGDPPGFYFLVALVITGTAASPGDKMFG